jgi:hypothetical protein
METCFTLNRVPETHDYLHQQQLYFNKNVAREIIPASDVTLGWSEQKMIFCTLNPNMTYAMHWSECSRNSLYAVMRGFYCHSGFALAEIFDEGIRQIGNCVPPLFMRSIAMNILRELLGKHSKTAE